MNTIELVGRAVLKIKSIPNRFPYAADSKLAGQFYRRFASGDKVFIANEEDAFCKAFDEGKIFTIDIMTNEEGQLSMVGFTTIAQEVNMKRTEVLLASFTLENMLAGKLDKVEELITL